MSAPTVSTGKVYLADVGVLPNDGTWTDIGTTSIEDIVIGFDGEPWGTADQSFVLKEFVGSLSFTLDYFDTATARLYFGYDPFRDSRRQLSHNYRKRHVRNRRRRSTG